MISCRGLQGFWDYKANRGCWASLALRGLQGRRATGELRDGLEHMDPKEMW